MDCRKRKRLGGLVVGAAAVLAGALRGHGATEEERYMAARLGDDARNILDNPGIEPEVAARAATSILRLAGRLDETNTRLLKMLAETARAAGKPAVQKEALKKVIAADPGDLVAQVKYLDLLAGANQVMEERSRVYEAALNQPSLHAQIRSQMAVRLAAIAEERGDLAKQREHLAKALTLNDVNVEALQGVVRLAGVNPRDVPGRLGALVALVSVSPYQPEAWVEMGRICARANAHDQGADYLTIALEQMQLQGRPGGGDLFLEMAYEQALAGRRGDAFGTVNSLARLPDAPVPALVLAMVLAQDEVAGVQGATLKSAREVIGEKIRKQLPEMVQAAPEDAGTLADAAGLDLTVMPEVGPETAGWVEQYGKLVEEGDGTLARLKGWLAYRKGDLDGAKAELMKVADSDPLAQVGLARVLLEQGQRDAGLKQLQEVWSGHPTGLLAVQVVQAAKKGGVNLAETARAKEFKALTARIPYGMLVAHRAPREVELVGLNVKKPSVKLGESWQMTVKLTNATDRAAAVGDNGLMQTTVGLSGGVRGLGATPLGLYALENLQRVYRVEARGTVEGSVPLDQGRVSLLLENQQIRTFVMNVSAATAPRMTATREMIAGLGGQVVAVGDVERVGVPMGARADVEEVLKSLKAARGGELLARIRVAGSLLAMVMGDKQDNSALTPEYENLKKEIVQAVLPYAKSESAAVRAAVARSMPAINLDELNGVLEGMALDADPMVRLMWSRRASQLALKAGDTGRNAMALMEKQVAAEQEEMIKDWLEISLAETRKKYDELNK